MTLPDAQAWAIIIVSVGGAMASVIAAFKANSARVEASAAKVESAIVKDQQVSIAKQVDTVEVNTNSRVTKQDLLIESLSKQVVELTAQIGQQNQHIAVLVSKELSSQPAAVPKPHVILSDDTAGPATTLVSQTELRK